MADATDARLRALYEAALDTVPALPRVVFQMHRLDELAYPQIAARLKIDVPTVEAFMCEALMTIATFFDGDPIKPTSSALIVAADARLRDRHCLFCERWIKRRRLRYRRRWLDPRSILQITDCLAVDPVGYDAWLRCKRPRCNMI